METTLPYGWYTDPEILRRERGADFPPRVAVRRPRRTARDAGLLRDARSAARPWSSRATATAFCARFVNVCRHRGFALAEGEQRRETLQCPYHAWTYGLDGGLRAAPRSEEEPDFPQDELGLVPVAVDTWGPFVFANVGPDPEPLAQALGSLPAQVEELGLDVDSLVHHSRWQAEIDANWKIVCENFLECYHCRSRTPASAR